MKRFVATARGRVQRVGYREHVYNETFERNISGYVKNLDTGEVEIVAEGARRISGSSSTRSISYVDP